MLKSIGPQEGGSQVLEPSSFGTAPGIFSPAQEPAPAKEDIPVVIFFTFKKCLK